MRSDVDAHALVHVASSNSGSFPVCTCEHIQESRAVAESDSHHRDAHAAHLVHAHAAKQHLGQHVLAVALRRMVDKIGVVKCKMT